MIQNYTELTGKILIRQTHEILSQNKINTRINLSELNNPISFCCFSNSGTWCCFSEDSSKVSFIFFVHLHCATVLPGLPLSGANPGTLFFSSLMIEYLEQNKICFWFSTTINIVTQKENGQMLNIQQGRIHGFVILQFFVPVWLKSLPQENHLLNTEFALCPWIHESYSYLLETLWAHPPSKTFSSTPHQTFQKAYRYLRLQGDIVVYF